MVFEIGKVCNGNIVYERNSVFNWGFDDRQVGAVERCVTLYHEWCENAKRTIYCWILVARKKKMARDIRGMISKMLWANRAAWSEGIKRS